MVFKGKDNYILQTVRGLDGNDRKKLPEAWLGKRGKDLSEVTGVPDAVFCHVQEDLLLLLVLMME